MKDIEERDRELYITFKKLFSSKNITYTEAVREAVNSPCSRYYISSDFIYREILQRLKGNQRIRRKHPRSTREKAYDQLFAKFLELSQLREFKGCSIRFISSFLVGRPAPSFFLSLRRAKSIIAKTRKKKI